MTRTIFTLTASVIVAAVTAIQGQNTRITVFDGARILDGNGGAPIENGRLVVQDGRITAVGSQSAVTIPAGATRIDVTGKTVMPAMINVHAHIGYEGYTTWGARNHTARERARSPAARSLLRRRRRDRRSAAARRRCRCSSSAISRRVSIRPRLDSSSCPAWRRPMAGRITSCAKRPTSCTSSTK